jgi:hypothetical protein
MNSQTGLRPPRGRRVQPMTAVAMVVAATLLALGSADAVPGMGTQRAYAAGVMLNSSPSVVYQPGADRITVFILGHDGRLYDEYYNGTGWVWEAQGSAGAPFKSSWAPGVVYQTTSQRVTAFAVGQDGRLYDKYYNGTQWVWEPQATP